MTIMKKVLVAGASGYLGRYAVNEFKERGYYVRALVRNSEKIKTPGPNMEPAIYNIADEIVTGDVTSPESLNGLCTGIDIVFSSLGLTSPDWKHNNYDVDHLGNKRILDQAVAEKVSRFIYVSVFNEDKMPDLPLIKAHELFVADLKASGLSWAVIRPNGYFSDMGRFFSMARTGHMFMVGEGEKKMNPIHGADIAMVCADAVNGDSREIAAGGPDIYTFREIMEGLNINNRSQSVMAISQLDIVLSAGKDRRIGQYYSIQNQFPAAYGIGAIGLPDSAAPQRKAQARQLKAYLMFFDQLLANYFAQLAHTKDLFSFYTEDSGTYFSQVIDDEHFSMDDIYGKGLDADRLVEITETTASESDEQAVGERKNRFLNHLLARFAEQFPDYLLQTDGKSLVQNKSAFLRDYPQIGAARGCGFDYTVQPGGKDNLSGLEKRISLKLDIPASISENSAGGGFYMVEHILLRPGLADVKTDQQESLFLAGPAGSDPYSNLVSFIFPDSELIRPNKTLIAKTLREETPAHIRMNIIYLKEGDMSTFESAYRTWLHNVTASDINRRNNREMIAARDRMAILLGMGIPYPSRDLRLTLDYANNIVPNNVSAKITLVGGQNDVRYQLCDVDGDPLVGSDGAFFETGPTDAATISLTTPVIKDDTTFKVLAIRENKEKTARMETYLDQSVAITVSINTSLPVYFTPPAGATASRKQQINVYYGGTVSVTVENTQVGFSYKLVSGTQDISSAINGNNGTIALVSSADKGFTQDTTINVLAYNTANPTVATNLKTKPSIKVIINTSLPVYFTPQGSDTSKKQQINVNYKSTVSVTVENTQVGFSYKLVSGTRDISSAINGNNGTITMVTLTEKGFTQDQTINVCAYITTTPTVAANLETNLIINVRPDPAVIVSCSSGFIVDYTGAATLTLASPQPNVTYSLYKRDAAITASDLTNNTDFTISAGYATRICFKIPTPITDWTNPAGFSFVGQFTLSTGNLSVSTGSRTEDTLFVIKATSTTNNLSQQLTMPAAIVVRPKVDLAINASKVSNSNTWNVTLASGVQKGVSYALRRNTDNTQVTASPTPQTQDNSTVTLSTGAITGTTATFNILATKSYQGVSVSAQLKQTVTINITPPNVVITPSN